jgi:hypothetical protein
MRQSFIVSCATFVAASLALMPATGVAHTLGGPSAAGGGPAFQVRPLAAKPAVNKRPGWISQQAKLSSQLIYVADGVANQVLIYPVGNPDPSPIGALTYGISEPEGMWVDGNGNLFVANTGNNTVEAFAHNQTKPYLIISQSSPGHQFGDTADVVVDRYGNTWVAALDGTVTEYAYGTTTAIQSPSAGLSEPIGMTFDGQGYLYVTDINPFANAHVFLIAPGWISGHVLPYVFSAPRIGGILFDNHQNTYIADQTDNEILIYARGSKTPTSTITSGILHPVFIAFDKNYNLYVQNFFNNSVTVYAYGGSTPIATITKGLMGCYGVAVWSDKY